jgi:hypothetical protein
MLMSRRETLVQLSDELVRALDEISERRGMSRSALIRQLLERFIAGEDEAQKDRRLVEGYRRFPPHEPDEWGDVQAWSEQAVAEDQPEEGWDESRRDLVE